MESKDFTIKDLISFGKYLLSEERQNRTSNLLQREVTHADVCNWQDDNVNEIPETAEEIEAFENKYSDENLPNYMKGYNFVEGEGILSKNDFFSKLYGISPNV